MGLMSEHLYVVKRDGTHEPVSFDQVLRRIQTLAGGLEHVNPDLVAQRVCSQIQNGIKTSELDEFAAETCAMMQARYHPNYGKLAARILIDNQHKTTPARLVDSVQVLFDEGIASESYYCAAQDLALETMIDYSRDFMFDYFGYKTLEKGYLLKRRDGRIWERPQHLWMRVAIQLHCNDVERVKETYDALSQGYFIHATPTLFNSGTKHAQLSSCFLVHTQEDSIKGIYDTLGECAQISKWAGGVGLSVHNIRARGADIKGTNGKSTGLTPMLKVFNDTAKYVNQGGKRNGSFAIYLEPWHADIEDFLRLKMNTGTDDERARDLFYGLWIPDLFMQRVEQDGMWCLMSPDECPGLSDCHGDEFNRLYTTYERDHKYVKEMPAKKLWQMIVDSQIQTGGPYLLYKDACTAKSNQKHLGTIKSSNLCSEIIEYTSPEETAVCNLGSLALPRFVKRSYAADGEYRFDFEALRTYTAILARNLDIVIDKTYYPTDRCARSNFRHRPIGIGVQGLADVFALLRIPWTSQAAADLNREIFEHIYYAAATASMLNASQDDWRGVAVNAGKAHPTFAGSPMSEGKLQCDLWGDMPKSALNWGALRKLCSGGMRNSLLIALMPTASTSQILGNNECIEPFTSNMYSRRVLAGEFMVVNKYLVDDLVRLGLWTSDIRTEIIANGGSVQSIERIPAELRELYRTVWEIPMKTIINMSRDRAPFVCQSQSLNLFIAEPTASKVSSMHFYAWKTGLKTGCYYLRTKGAARAQQFTVEPPTCLTCSS
jgi:ribonucleoside-diphosphate reductase alpha chain